MIFYIVILAVCIFFVVAGIDLVKTGGFYQKIQGIVGLIGGTIGILYSVLELLFKYILKYLFE